LKELRHYKSFYNQAEIEKALETHVIVHMTGFFYVINRAWNEVTNHPAKSLFVEYCSMLRWNQDVLQKDTRVLSVRVKDFFIHTIPKPVMIRLAAWIYNGWRVKNIQKQSDRVRGVR